MSSQHFHHHRGMFLTIMLVYFGYPYIKRLLAALNPAAYPAVYSGGPEWMQAYAFLSTIAAVAALIGVVRWQKWGVYLIFASFLADVLINQFAFTPPAPLWSILSYAIMAGLIFWAVKREWYKFR